MLGTLALKPGNVSVQIIGMGASGKRLVLLPRLTNGSIVAVAWVHRRIVGQH